MPENAHGTTTRAQSRQTPAAPHQILRACAVKMHFEDFERDECSVSSNEIAGRPDEAPRLNTGPYTYRKNPSVTTLFGGKNELK